MLTGFVFIVELRQAHTATRLETHAIFLVEPVSQQMRLRYVFLTPMT